MTGPTSDAPRALMLLVLVAAAAGIVAAQWLFGNLAGG
jgi:hypothetical protein